MKRRFVFENTPVGRLDFRMIYETLWNLDPKSVEKDDRRFAVEAQTALQHISEPIGQQGDDDIDIRLRRLSDRGEMVISQRAFERISQWVEQYACHPALFAHQQDLLERLSAAERVDGQHSASRVWGKPGA